MSDETVVDQAPEQTVEQTATEPEQSNEPADDLVDFDAGGRVVKLPKDLSEKLTKVEQLEKDLLADYTRKTQTAAEARKQAEEYARAEREAIQREREILSANEELAAARYQLKQYQSFTPEQWQAFGAENPAAAQAEFIKMQALQRKADSLQSAIQQDQARKAFESQQSQAKRLEQAAAEVRAAIPDWSDAKDRELADYARKQLGAPESATGLPAWVIKAVHKASLYDKSLKAATTPASPNVQPTKTVSGPAKAGKRESDMSMDEWVKNRNKELRGR